MAIEEIGIGVGSGSLLGAVLTYLGFKQRIDKVEKANEIMKDKIRFVDTCIEIHKSVDRRLENIENKQDTGLEILTELKELTKR